MREAPVLTYDGHAGPTVRPLLLVRRPQAMQLLGQHPQQQLRQSLLSGPVPATSCRPSQMRCQYRPCLFFGGLEDVSQPLEARTTATYSLLTSCTKSAPWTANTERAFCSDASSENTSLALHVTATLPAEERDSLCQHGSSAKLCMLAGKPLVPVDLCSYVCLFTFSVNTQRATYWGHHCGQPSLCPPKNPKVPCSKQPARLLTAWAELHE